MLAPAFPVDEAARIDELRRLDVLDTPAEARFDRITRTARRVFGVPMALVTLVDADRQWFKSRQGLDVCETPRGVSFCGHAILQDGAFVVPDTLADPRFADNPLVTGAPHLRFYAGLPLHGRGGHRLGTLCVLDTVARDFGPEEVRALADLAGWAELELNLYTVEQATALAREHGARLQAVVDHAGEGIVTLTDDGRVRSFNPAAERVFGRDGRQALGASVLEWVAPASRKAVAADFAGGASAPAGGAVRREVDCVRADGAVFPAEVVVTRLPGPGGGWTLLVRDVSERKQVERMKNEFISTVSHELRTPLTAVRGAVGLVLGGAAGEVSDKARSLLAIASSSCDRLVRLVNDMLDIEKIESGNVRFELAPQRLLGVVRQAIGATEAFAQPLQVRLALRPQAGDARVMADADRLTQVVVNLLSNAVKFSPAGGEVEVDVVPLDGGARVRLVVADRGAGIPEAVRGRLFSRFVQGDASDSRRQPGTGLGLAISRAIVERLGGRIGFVDREGGGTEFHVDLPVVPAAAAAAAAGQEGAVLVCEDDAQVAGLIAELLGQGGLACDIAADAAQARQRLATRRYRAMTLDIGLPGEDGLSLLRWVRSQPEHAALPVVVLTGHVSTQALGAAFGAVDWLAKPVDSDRLLQALRHALRVGGARPAVLHVEDDPDLARLVATVLHGHCDAEQAVTLAQARARLSQRAYDLILLDLKLPDGDGSELLAGLPPPNAATPVVIFSGTEPAVEVAAQVRESLVKSRTSTGELAALLGRVMGLPLLQAGGPP